MNKSIRRPRLVLTRSSLRLLQEDTLAAVAGGRRRTNSDPIETGVEYTCVPTSDTTTGSVRC